MKNQKQIENEMERLFMSFMDPSKKKPLRDESYIQYHKLKWVLEDEADIIEKRLKEIASGNKTPQT